MGRDEKIMDTVFTGIVENNNYFSFLKEKNHSNDLIKYCGDYQKLLDDLKPQMVKLSILETLIIQLRSKEKLKVSIIFFVVNKNYIYARAPFYRIDKDINDIRTIVGKTDIHGDDVNLYSSNLNLYNTAVEKLSKIMDKHIQITKNSL